MWNFLTSCGTICFSRTVLQSVIMTAEQFSDRLQCWFVNSLVADRYYVTETDRRDLHTHTHTFSFYFQGIPASTVSRTFRVPVWYLQTWNINIQRTVILPVVLCGCKTWYVTLRKNTGWRVYNSDAICLLRGTNGVLNTIQVSPSIEPT
jgi:hypothetical protein